MQILEKKEVAKCLPNRERDTHKGDYGRAGIVAGNAQFLGAPVLSTLACLRSGAGYTYLFTPIKEHTKYALRLPEAIISRLKFSKKTKLYALDSLAVGMGMGQSKRLAKLAVALLENFAGRLVLDADALNSLAKYKADNLDGIFLQKKGEVVITPHIKEFSRLTKLTVAEILQDPVKHAQDFAQKWQITVLLKGARTVITDGKRTVINERGTAGQAKGGSGDLLSGLIAGLCAQGLSVFDGAKAGAYLAGYSAEIAEKDYGEYSLLATDTAECLGKAFLALRVAENADEQGDNE